MKNLKLMSTYEKTAKIGGALGGVGAGGFITGAVVASGVTLTAAAAAPIALIVGTGVAVGAGISSLAKFIFD